MNRTGSPDSVCFCRFLKLNITTATLDIIDCPVFYLKHDISGTEWGLRLQVEQTEVDPLDRASRCLQTPEIAPSLGPI
jgi:hypothetical protein